MTADILQIVDYRKAPPKPKRRRPTSQYARYRLPFFDRNEILPLKASTPAGLAVQVKAVVFAAADLWDIIPDDEPDDYNPHERLFIEAACAFCGIAPLPMQRRQARALAKVS